MYLWSRTTHRSGCRSDLIVADLPLVRMDIGGVEPLAVPQSDIGLGLGLLQIQWLIQILVDEVILRALLTADVTAGWHADQMHLQHKRYFSSSLILEMCDFIYIYLIYNSIILKKCS